jgi:hypothetical protein
LPPLLLISLSIILFRAPFIVEDSPACLPAFFMFFLALLSVILLGLHLLSVLYTQLPHVEHPFLVNLHLDRTFFFPPLLISVTSQIDFPLRNAGSAAVELRLVKRPLWIFTVVRRSDTDNNPSGCSMVFS